MIWLPLRLSREDRLMSLSLVGVMLVVDAPIGDEIEIVSICDVDSPLLAAITATS